MRTRLPQARRMAAALAPSRAPATAPRAPAPWRPSGAGADLDRALRFGHRFEGPPISGAPPLGVPIQRNGPENEADEADEARQRKANLLDRPRQVDERTHDAIATSNALTGRQVLSGISGLGSAAQVAARGADYLDARGLPGVVAPAIGIASNPIAALGSVVEGGTKLHQAATGGEKLEDKALLGLEATSSFGNAALSAASGARYASEIFGGSAAGAIASAAGPAALVMGGADLVGGFAGNRLAEHRQQELSKIARANRGQQGKGFEYATATLAATSQATKKRRSLGTFLKGGLAIGGGAALLAGAGPIGWGLLGGAALLGGGMTLYKQYRKHKMGKKILASPAFQAKLTEGGHVSIPTAEDLAGQKWTKRWNPLNTKESRTYDLIRGQLGQHLERELHTGLTDEDHDDPRAKPLQSIVGLLGLRNKGDKKANAKDIARALEG